MRLHSSKTPPQRRSAKRAAQTLIRQARPHLQELLPVYALLDSTKTSPHRLCARRAAQATPPARSVLPRQSPIASAPPHSTTIHPHRRHARRAAQTPIHQAQPRLPAPLPVCALLNSSTTSPQVRCADRAAPPTQSTALVQLHPHNALRACALRTIGMIRIHFRPAERASRVKRAYQARPHARALGASGTTRK